jgi:hypothetical protein
MNNKKSTSPRRQFIGRIAAGAAAIGIMSIPQSIKAAPSLFNQHSDDDADQWFNKVKGKHRMVFDVTAPHGVFPFAWPRGFLLTNQKTGTPASDIGVVVILRHDAIPYAFGNDLWTKYDFGTHFKLTDPITNNKATRNAFWQPKPNDFSIPGIGNVAIGINDLQADGVMFCVCDMAITVHSAVIAGALKKDAADVKKDWINGLLPGIQVVPSGVWAVGRAQEHDCKYCFVG